MGTGNAFPDGVDHRGEFRPEHQHFCLTVIHDVFDFRAGQPVVDGHQNGPGLAQAEIHVKKFHLV